MGVCVSWLERLKIELEMVGCRSLPSRKDYRPNLYRPRDDRAVGADVTVKLVSDGSLRPFRHQESPHPYRELPRKALDTPSPGTH